MKIRRRRITSETIYNNETGNKEPRFPRFAVLKLKRHSRPIQVGKRTKMLPSKYVKAVRGKLTGRTKGAFGKSKWLEKGKIPLTLTNNSVS